MGESVQTVLALLMIVGMFGGVLVFMNDRVNWVAFSAMLALAAGSLGLLIWSMVRRDNVPDFLAKVRGPLLERDGFCSKILVKSVKGRCFLDLYFQGRYDRPSRAMVVLQPSKGFFLTRPGLASVTVEAECPEAGYGVTSLPWPVAKAFQGKTQSLDVGADVFYPEGKGTMVRFRGGVQVRTAGLDAWQAVLTLAGAMGGMVVLSRPAKVKITLPADVEESVDDDAPISSKVLWKLGDKTPSMSVGKGLGVDPEF